MQKSGTASALELDQANLTVEQSMISVINAAGQEALAHFQNKDSVDAQTAAVNASNGAALQLAASMNGPLPQALLTVVAGMNDSSLSAIGATRSITGTNDAVINLRDGKTITITAKDLASAKLNELDDRQLDAKILYIDLITRTDNKVAPDWLSPGKNRGGWIPGAGPDVDSRLTPTTPGEFVVTRKAAQRYGPWLEAINAAAGGDVRMPESGLAAIPTARLPIPDTAASMGRVPALSGGSASAGGGAGGRTMNVTVNMNAVKTLPTARELENVLHDVQLRYGA